MADHFSGRFLPGKALPLRVGGRLEADLRLVHPPEKEAELPDDLVGRGHRRVRRLAFDEVRISRPCSSMPRKRGAPSKPTRSKWRSSACTAGAPRSGVPANRVADLDDGRQITAVEHLLGHERSIRSAASCSRRRSFSSSSIARIVSPMRVPG